MRVVGAILREAAASAWAQPVASLVSIVIVAAMCASVLLTTGRTVGAEDAVLSTIDSTGTRSIVVRAETASGLDSTVLDRLANVDGIEAALAFGPATDTRATAFAGGAPVPVRTLWGDGLLDARHAPEHISPAWASPTALDELGLLDGTGSVATNDGRDYSVVAELAVPDYLAFLEPLVVAPQPDDRIGPVSVLVVIADTPDLVGAVASATGSLLAVDDPTTVSLATSEGIAQLRAIIEGQLGTFGRELVLVIFGISALLVAAILYGFTMLRRKDYGRRRALGATRTLIVTLVLLQMTMVAIVGAALGTGAALATLTATGDPLPGTDFAGAVAILAVTVAVIAALLPAIVAARRDPIRELRVP